MRIRFQADADLNPAVGRGRLRREPLIDWRPARGIIPDGTSDLEVLRLASDDERVLVSRDVHTMPRHFANFITARPASGVILIPPSAPLADVIDKLLIAWLSWTAEDLKNQIWWLPA